MSHSKTNNTEQILEVLKESSSALSHQEIQSKIENSCNRVTIYRILDRLIEKGEIHKIIDIDGVSKFAICDHCKKEKHNHNHIHFSCTKCLKVTCLNDTSLSFEIPNNYTVSEMNFTLTGLCPSCS